MQYREPPAIIPSGTLSMTFGRSGTKLWLRLAACQSLSAGVLESPADIIAGGSDKTSDLHVPVLDIVLRALRYNRKGDNNG